MLYIPNVEEGIEYLADQRALAHSQADYYRKAAASRDAATIPALARIEQASAAYYAKCVAVCEAKEQAYTQAIAVLEALRESEHHVIQRHIIPNPMFPWPPEPVGSE